MSSTIILGGGMTGLAAGVISHFPVFEASNSPGGICTSYFMNLSGEIQKHPDLSTDEVYHFMNGGGHWIFGIDSVVQNFVERFITLRKCKRRSSVFFPERRQVVPYPIQDNLRFLNDELIIRVLSEVSCGNQETTTMKDWLLANFGATLCDLFFFPFHKLYTADFYSKIAPEDHYKSPGNFKRRVEGALKKISETGYNVDFYYPESSLSELAEKMASLVDIRFCKEVINIDLKAKCIHFSDNTFINYDNVISTLPLNQVLNLASLKNEEMESPYVSVLVLNVGATKGSNCPNDHWLYIPRSKSGFHRVGFYSNVDCVFLPKSKQNSNTHVSLYIERSFPGGSYLSREEIDEYSKCAINELIEWKFIEQVEVKHESWIKVAYTWSFPNSSWREKSIKILSDNGVFQVGRYGKWKFQGIADSIKDGLLAGSCFRCT